MTDRVSVGGLQVAQVLYDFVQNEALPGTGVDSEKFWSGVEAVITDLAPKNKALLGVRDEIQGKVDAWHGEHAGPNYDRSAYTAFLKEIGYLVDEPADFHITTSGVDTEITSTAGPQLVVPVLNARFAINASNAR
ncbi:malate synthase G, partial [Rhodococcus sp. 06-156-4a]